MKDYQVMPPLTAEEYEALKADIEARGVQVPIEFDTDGNCIDGHHRLQICEELGITDYPTVTRTYDSETAKFTQARVLNMTRRHLTRDQRREMIRDQIKATPEMSDRQIAAQLGVSHPTVGTLRKEMEAAGDVEKFTTSTDAIGRTQPRHRTVTVYNPSERETEALRDPDIRRRLIENEKLNVRGAMREQKIDRLVERLEDPDVQREKAERGVYDVVIVDPPEGMTIEEIEALEIPAHDTAHVFLWADGGNLPERLKVFNAWKVKGIMSFVCEKDEEEMRRIDGTPFIDSAHFILYAHKGAPQFVDEKQFWAFAPDGREGFYKMIRRVTAGRRVIMFAEDEVDGYDRITEEERQ